MATELACLSCGMSLSHAATVERFGLTHFYLCQANVSSNNGSIVQVTRITSTGQDGVATELGAADSGAFFFPFTAFLNGGYSMRGEVYGSVNGRPNSLIGIMTGYYVGYSSSYASADFSAIGATSLTFELWKGSAKVAERTVSSGIVEFRYAGPPRVNPWWRQANGEYGASIEFTFPPSVILPGCPTCPAIEATRVFIRPNGTTGVVDFVSQTSAFGAGGLETFDYNQIQLG